MLKNTKSVTLTGRSMVNDQQVAIFNATIYKNDGTTDSINTMITNKALYQANKTEVRKDLSEFQNLVFEAQDQSGEI